MPVRLDPRTMQLSCRHEIPWPDNYKTLAGGWYAAQPCPYCNRKRAVISASFGPARLT